MERSHCDIRRSGEIAVMQPVHILMVANHRMQRTRRLRLASMLNVYRRWVADAER